MLNNLEKAEITYPTYSTPFENQSVYNMRSCNKQFDNSTTPTTGTYTTSTIPAQSVDLSVGLYNEKVIDYNKDIKPDGYKEEPEYKELGNVVQDIQNDLAIKESFIETASSQTDQEYSEPKKVLASKVMIDNLKSHFKKFKKDLSSKHALKINKDISDLENKLKTKKISIMDLKEKCNKIKEEIQEKIHRVESEKFTNGSKILKIITLIIFIIIICLGGWLIFKTFISPSPVIYKPNYIITNIPIINEPDDGGIVKTVGAGGEDGFQITPLYKFLEIVKNKNKLENLTIQKHNLNISAKPFNRPKQVIKEEGGYEENEYDNYEEDEYDNYGENEYDNYEENEYDNYEENKYDNYEEDEYDNYEENEYDNYEENEIKDPLKDDSNFTVDMNNISLEGGSRLDNKIKF